MTDTPADASRLCLQVRAHLPGLAAGTLPGWRRRLVAMHLRRCPDCPVELERQRAVAAALDRLSATPAAQDEPPPEGLLDALLEQAGQPGLRGRAAVPARGAVSGARPGLSVLLLVLAAAAGTALGYTSWRSVRALRGRIRRPSGTG